MDIGSFANFLPRKGGAIISRAERIKREGSPNYPYALPVTAAAAVVILYIPAQFPDSRKYQPLDFLEVVNNDPNNSLTITINNADTYYCPAGTIRTISGDGVALWQVQITNNGAGATGAGLVQLTFKKEALTTDKWVRRL